MQIYNDALCMVIWMGIIFLPPAMANDLYYRPCHSAREKDGPQAFSYNTVGFCSNSGNGCVGFLVLDIRALSALICGLRSPVPQGNGLERAFTLEEDPNKHERFSPESGT